jgi:hypothetical protein
VRSRRKARDTWEPAVASAEQEAALDDARELALEISRGVPSHHFDAMSAGLVLGPEETAYRRTGAWLLVQEFGSWALPSWTQVAITDQRLLCCCNDGRLLSLCWTEVAGVQVALDQQSLLISCCNQPPITFTGAGTAVLGVAAVSMLYGPGALLTHPALSPLRCESPPMR